MNRAHHLIAATVVTAGVLFASGAIDGCKGTTAQDILTGADVAIKVADDVCAEITNDGGDPAWVTLVCSVVGAADGRKAQVTLPRAVWAARKPCPPPCNVPAWDAATGGK